MTRDSVEWYERSWGHVMRVYLGIVLGTCAGTWALARLLHIPVDRVSSWSAGFLTLGGTWPRPWWFLGMIYLGFFTAVRIVR
jgi:hypothetical protein